MLKDSRIGYRGEIRSDLDGTYFRSRSEANYARYLKFLGIEFEHEPKIFFFPGIRQGNVSYRPDFYLPKEDRWVEVKGYLDASSKTKLKRFKKYYPTEFERLTVAIWDPWSESKSGIDAMKFLETLGIPLAKIESCKEIEQKLGGLIPNWE